jgi:hypothetical protein
MGPQSASRASGEEMNMLARPRGFEPLTSASGGSCSTT